MDRTIRNRWIMAGAGAIAGACLYGLVEMSDRGALDERALLGLFVLTGVFFTAWLLLAGPLSLRRAALPSLALGAVAAGLLVWASTRFDDLDRLFFEPVAGLAAFVLVSLSLPFIVAAGGPGWRHYPTLFDEAWSAFGRLSAAVLFTGIVWGVIFLSDAVLSLVGVTVIERLIDIAAVPWVLSGAVSGLALSVLSERAELLSPKLLLRLLRLLLPVVLVVTAVFIVVLPFRGLSDLFGDLSAAATLIGIVAVAATLVSSAIDRDDAEASESPMLRVAAQALAALMPVPAALAVWAVWLRVSEYGWTPERVLAACAAGLALGYGVAYAASLLRGRDWMAGVRAGNVWLAAAIIVLCAALLTPALNPERIAANSQLARILADGPGEDGERVRDLTSWGRAGAGAMAVLKTRAAEPGQEALALALVNATAAETRDAEPGDPQVVRDRLRAVLPMQPASATAFRDALLDWLSPGEMQGMIASCERTMPYGKPGCVLVVADFWPADPGDEAVVLFRDEGYTRRDAYSRSGDQWTYRLPTFSPTFPDDDAGAIALITALQAGPPRLTPLPGFQIEAAGTALMVLPQN